MSDCIFCQVVQRQLSAKIAYEDEQILAFHDKYPQAPTHLLIIPKEHIPTLWDIDPNNQALLKAIFHTIQTLAQQFDSDRKGFRVVNNCGTAGLQTIYHIHFHFLAGRWMKWPPG